MVDAILQFAASPKAAAVYNIGGGRRSNCSMLEAIEMCERIAGRELDWTLSGDNRVGDHRWWISDLGDFERDYPGWNQNYGIEQILEEIHASQLD
jgi:CDP-paratose 2-epimerase